MVYLRQLSASDGQDVFEMLKGIQTIEHSFKNPVHDMSFQQYREWLHQQEMWALGKGLPSEYVPQIIYWLYDDNEPVGIGKIRRQLTPASRRNGGNIGYAISKDYRGHGYGKKLLELLLSEARKLQIDEVLLTVDRDNLRSKRICEECGGTLIDENAERRFYKF